MAIGHKRVLGAALVAGSCLVHAFSPAVSAVQAFSPVAQALRPALSVAHRFSPVVQGFSPAMTGSPAVPAQSPTFGVGKAPTPDQLKLIDIDVTPDGKGLLPGSGTAAKGKDVYTRRCETCHGPTGKEGPQEALAGGKGSLATPKPQKSVGSYWPYATTLWDYINRAMPFDHPSTLTPDEVYSATAYVLFLNGLVSENDVLDQTSLPNVQMPNRNGFVTDPRPDVPRKK